MSMIPSRLHMGCRLPRIRLAACLLGSAMVLGAVLVGTTGEAAQAQPMLNAGQSAPPPVSCAAAPASAAVSPATPIGFGWG